MSFTLAAAISLARPKHWIKNGFILAPLFLSFQFFNIPLLLRAIAAFCIFCAASSAVYAGNDIIDRERDKFHEKKRLRPIASGTLSVSAALIIFFLLAILSLTTAFFLSPAAGFCVLVYIGLNSVYTFYLKRLPIVDVFILAAGFVVRVIVGAEVINVPISHWMILITIFLSLFLGFGKRYSEIQKEDAGEHRKVLSAYTPEVLKIYVMMCGILSIVTYAFYTIDIDVAERFYTSRLLYSIPVVAFGLFRYILLVIGRGEGGDVAELVIKDKVVLASIVVWVCIILWAHRW